MDTNEIKNTISKLKAQNQAVQDEIEKLETQVNQTTIEPNPEDDKRAKEMDETLRKEVKKQRESMKKRSLNY